MIRCLLLICVALGSATALAGDRDDLERRATLLQAHRQRLERRLDEQVRRVQRLKEQTPGVGRDYQLKTALQSSQQLAQRLTALQARLRTTVTELLSAYDRAIAAASDDGQRAALRRARARWARPGRATRIVTDPASSPYDSPDDLEAKADLLQDSEEKVRRQLVRLRRQLAQLEHRSRLQRHAQAADDSPFVENAARRTIRARQAPSKSAANTGTPAAPTRSGDEGSTRASPPPGDGTSKSAEAEAPNTNTGFQTDDADYAGAAPTPADPSAEPGLSSAGGGGRVSGSGGVDPTGASGVSLTIQDVVDPALLKRLERGGGGDLRGRITALRDASAKLRNLATGLKKKARVLRDKARKLRRGKGGK